MKCLDCAGCKTVELSCLDLAQLEIWSLGLVCGRLDNGSAGRGGEPSLLVLRNFSALVLASFDRNPMEAGLLLGARLAVLAIGDCTQQFGVRL